MGIAFLLHAIIFATLFAVKKLFRWILGSAVETIAKLIAVLGIDTIGGDTDHEGEVLGRRGSDEQGVKRARQASSDEE